MNKDNAHLYLPLIEALAMGKTIQVKNLAGKWTDYESVVFSNPPEDYRIKTEPRKPREWTVCIISRKYDEGTLQFRAEFAGKSMSQIPDLGWITLREVIKDEL